MKDIYELKLHEGTEVRSEWSTFYVVRVHGGWLYTIFRFDSNSMTTTFVPFYRSRYNEEK